MLKNKKIIILGGNGRLGCSFVENIVKNNGQVIIGDINFSKIKTLQKKYGKDKILYKKCDISSEKSLLELSLYAKKIFNKIDAAIQCAYPRTSDWGLKLELLNEKSLKKNLDKQLAGSILFAKIFFNFFKAQKFGNLIFISSIYGFSNPDFKIYEDNYISPIEYSAIKSAIISISKYIAKYSKNLNIRSNTISPGGILDEQSKKFQSSYKKKSLSKGLLDPNDISGALIFLLSDNSKFINGHNLIVDDGWTL